MRIAITGATGFVGRHLARALSAAGHDTVLIARGRDLRDPAIRTLARSTFVSADLSDPAPLAEAFAGCDAVAHCAGINREIGAQTYRAVHIDGTTHVIDAARRARVPRLLLLSFLRARPDCGSPYHESKWVAEELVRASGLDYTILKSGMIYGLGDHMLDHLSHTLHTLPLFATVGFREQPIRPVAIDDVIDLHLAAILHGRLSRQTVVVLGPETLLLSDAVRRVAQAVGRRVWIVLLPSGSTARSPSSSSAPCASRSSPPLRFKCSPKASSPPPPSPTRRRPISPLAAPSPSTRSAAACPRPDRSVAPVRLLSDRYFFIAEQSEPIQWALNETFMFMLFPPPALFVLALPVTCSLSVAST
jgi:NADH dehydrogenase